MSKVVLKEEELVKVIENSVARALEIERKKDSEKKYHLTEAELRGVIQHFVEKNK